MFYYPLNYEQINLISSTYVPSAVHLKDNKSYAFWERALFQRAISVLKINLPNDWEGSVRDFFNYCLFRLGYVAIFNHEKYGDIFNPCTVSGYDIFYRPTTAIVTNPAFDGSLEMEIGKDCEILKLTPDYMGIWDVISYYAEKLALLDNAINMSLINNKFAFMFAAKNKPAAEALKKMIDLVNSGEPAVIYDRKIMNDANDKSEPWHLLERTNLKESYLTTQQLSDFRTLINNFDSEIGIPTLATEKKERMIESEANATQYDSKSRVRVWIETLNASAKEVQKLYPNIKISCELRDDLEGGVQIEDNSNRDVSL